MDKERREIGRKVEDLSRQLEASAKEIDGYKERLKQYGDYDEIKRELEIMKVRLPFVWSSAWGEADRLGSGFESTSSLLGWTSTTYQMARTLSRTS